MHYEILMLDDDLKNLKATKRFLELNGLSVTITDSIGDAIELARINEYALILLDFNMAKLGHKVAEEIKLVCPRQQIAMYSCDQSRDALKQSLQAGAIDFIEKDREPTEILSTIYMYCRRYDELIRTVGGAKNKSDKQRLIESVGMIGASETSAKLVSQILQIATSAAGSSVHIHGPSGAGKELAAKAIHEKSDRSKRPFIAINCAAIPKDLLESTLFGHKRGSFTGATADQEGKFVQADRGTIFLDEIAELPLELQAKLLRVTQERVVDPIGGSPRKIDVQIISATHQNLEELVKQGRFREDLMYRIKVIQIDIAPLKDRVDDIEPLIEFFTTQFNSKRGGGGRFQRRTLDILKRYQWPGNVRELSNMVERQLILAGANDVRPEDLDLKLYQTNSAESHAVKLTEFDGQQLEAKISYIHSVIESAGSKAEAARRLGVTAPHLQYLLSGSKAARSKAAVGR
jgi:DNA-binding NtrC family response regulator